ncbi:hypothetical protein AB834_06740 [PVC group bacterium (ex Bugula neritina AB1)]|nr:hypothetical protein AB834_06740 [PVC group bacterium (ex Bugula neritina AB1)]
MIEARQQTLKEPVCFEGIGVHTGHQVSLVVKPAPVDHGFVFVRIDLEGHPKVPAEVSYVVDTARGTTIAHDDVFIHTIEHLLSALIGIGVDNALIEIDGDEVPILDGSSACFAEKIKDSGMIEQESFRKCFAVSEPIAVEKSGMSLTALPYEGLRISFTIEYEHPYLPEQSKSYLYSSDTFIEEVARARTFCFDFEVDYLKNKGLIKGGSLENAVVITDQGILNENLRFEDEFVRHKILDIIGDLVLLGSRINAHIVSHKSGHHLNVELVKALKKEILKQEGVENPPKKNLMKQGRVLSVNDIQQIIPHRYPFLLIDRIIETDGEKTAVGLKNVTVNEPFFQGHFPGHMIMPGVLILEALAQTAACLMLAKVDKEGLIAYFMSMDQVKFRRPVLPGDTLLLKVVLVRARNKVGAVEGHAYVGEEVVAQGRFKFAFVDEEK